MKTRMESRTLGESKSTFSNIATIRQTKQHGEYSKDQKSTSGGGAVTMSLLVGAGAGILAGLLLAPEKGQDMRKRVTDSATKLGDQANKGLAAAKVKISSLTKKSGGEQSDQSDGSMSGTTPPAPAMGEAPGTVHKSPYTDPNKHSDSEVKSMINDPKTPGATNGPSIPPKV